MTWTTKWEPRKDKSNPELYIIGGVFTYAIIGDLALDFTDEGWNIYHVPTGACFDSAVPNVYMRLDIKAPVTSDYEYDKDQLLNWMKKVQENYPTAWTMLRLLKPENYATNGTSAKKIIQEWCLSVKVE